jgi:hypothetical protein
VLKLLGLIVLGLSGCATTQGTPNAVIEVTASIKDSCDPRGMCNVGKTPR